MTRTGFEPVTKGLRGPCSSIELAGQTWLLYREEALCQDSSPLSVILCKGIKYGKITLANKSVWQSDLF